MSSLSIRCHSFLSAMLPLIEIICRLSWGIPSVDWARLGSHQDQFLVDYYDRIMSTARLQIWMYALYSRWFYRCWLYCRRVSNITYITFSCKVLLSFLTQSCFMKFCAKNDCCCLWFCIVISFNCKIKKLYFYSMRRQTSYEIYINGNYIVP